MILELNFKDKKKPLLPKYSFSMKEVIGFMKAKYDISKIDSIELFLKMIERNWIEPIADEKKVKHSTSSIYKLVNI